jgi:hypothetical protein
MRSRLGSKQLHCGLESWASAAPCRRKKIVRLDSMELKISFDDDPFPVEINCSLLFNDQIIIPFNHNRPPSFKFSVISLSCSDFQYVVIKTSKSCEETPLCSVCSG